MDEANAAHEALIMLLLQAYTPGCTTRAIAKRLGRSEDGLYQLLRRLRLELKQCVELGLDEEGGFI